MANGNNSSQDAPIGLVLITASFFAWGLLPFLLKAVGHISTIEVLAHRVIWAIPLVGFALVITGKIKDIGAAFKSAKTMLMASLCALLVSVNWGIYVWAIAQDKALEASMGYYITPLLAVFLGATLLKEHINNQQKISVALAVIAVILLAFDLGTLPWVSIGLAGTWSVYSFLRKTLPIGANQGFMLEVLILLIPACVIVFMQLNSGHSHFVQTGLQDSVLLILCGIATAVPLMLFTNGVRQVRMLTIGLMQFIVPSLIFLIAVFVFDEPFTTLKLVAFILIWAAMIIFARSLILEARAKRLTSG